MKSEVLNNSVILASYISYQIINTGKLKIPHWSSASAIRTLSGFPSSHKHIK